MNKIKLNIFFLCEKDKEYDRLSDMDTVLKTRFKFVKWPQNSGMIDDQWNHVIISDSIQQLEPYLNGEYQNVWLVYTGEFCGSLAAFTDTEKLKVHLDIWPCDEEDTLRRFRFRGLIKRIRDWYDSKWYQNLLTTSIDSIPDLVWYKDARGVHTMVNQAFCDTVHKTKDDVRGRGHYYIWDITPEEYSSGEYVCMESEDIVMQEGKTCLFEEQVKTSEGMKRFNTYKTPIFDLDGKTWGTVGIAHDVTSFSNMGIELSILVENIPFPMIICSDKWETLQMNSYFQELFHISHEDIAKFNYPSFKKELFTPYNELKENPYNHSVTQEFSATVNGKELIISITEQEIRDFFDNVSGYFCMLRDVTVERSYEKRILELANTDSLTGLPNRRYFYDYVLKHITEPMFLLYMDLDHFKEVNDNFGHARGDEVLCRTAKKIREIFPQGVVARLGGDEFALLLPGDTDESEVAVGVKKLQDAVRAMFRRDGFYITMSVGIAKSGGGSNVDMDDFIHLGDQNMYAQKENHHAGRDM